MARTNLTARRIKPETTELITVRVLRRELISEHFVRVTVGGAELERFVPLGFDQWFRLFLPVPGGTLDRVPSRLTTLSYARFLTVAKLERPVLRNYTVRAFRPIGPEGPELDIDFVRHGSGSNGSGDDATAGPATVWADTCEPGDVAAILDEGVGFNPPPDTDRVILVADETGLPATAAILASLPEGTRGVAVIEVPALGDRQELPVPFGVEVTWVTRADPTAVPGQAALAVATDLAGPDSTGYGWVVGEQSLASGLRRHWVRTGTPKDRVMFCGYWRSLR
ncbi:siderophore-interacting protein [Microlunatus parietis]|uniref:NADPH-dependent ferric siderophore reductase n=1 Tax=Microlunatus parietis TaxID=682979 RepID=A0A7Y9I3H0_9ACTN|nr:siderophore-interacting protein [Microlunatus parietis]NYE69503.1 NADPH-dependent ferric siderophore reductase [Microlunatus parietis]